MITHPTPISQPGWGFPLFDLSILPFAGISKPAPITPLTRLPKMLPYLASWVATVPITEHTICIFSYFPKGSEMIYLSSLV